MLQHDENIITVVDNAFKAGFYIPKYTFHSVSRGGEVEDKKLEGEVYHNYPMYFSKPEGIEFTYIIFWNGHRFCGGFISINNTYKGVQRGGFDRNGETLFASHIHEIKMGYKKFTKKDEPRWIAHSFVITEEGKIFYWGLDNVEHYKDLISNIVGENFEDLVEIYLRDERTRRPQGFISSLMIYDDKDNKTVIENGEVQPSISASWKDLYDKVDKLPKNLTFTLCLDNYIRKGYAILKAFNKLS